MGGVYCLIEQCSPEVKDWAALILIGLVLTATATGLIVWMRNR